LQDFFHTLAVYLENIKTRTGFHITVIMVFCGSAGNLGSIQAQATHQKSTNVEIFRPASSQFSASKIHVLSEYSGETS
jgi:hypothetical protein